MACQMLDKLQGILVGGAPIDLEARDDFALDDFAQRSHAVGGLPDHGGGLVEAEQGGVRG